jgi:hypothetical protein
MKLPKIQPQILFLGVCMMLMNVGSRYIVDEFSTKAEEYQRNIFLRRVAIFAVCYMGTRDLVHALLLTAGFVVLAMGISRTHPNEGFSGSSDKSKKSSMHDDAAPLFLDKNGNDNTQKK